MEKIAVHSGDFHADDVFAVAILKLIYPKISVIRTRDEEKLKTVDARIDVGFKYNPKTGDYDHHQKEGAGKRKNGIPYASAGLIWKHFGRELAETDFVWDYIDKKLIQHIDCNDIGLKTYEVKEIDPYKIDNIISAFNPSWPEDDDVSLYDKGFENSVSFATEILKNELRQAKSNELAENLLKREIKDKNQEYLILGRYVPWKDYIISNTNIKFVVYKAPKDDYWVLRAVPKNMTTFENRKDLPKSWAGLREEDLAKVTGVKDAKFCHNQRFIASAYSKEGVLKLLEIVMGN